MEIPQRLKLIGTRYYLDGGTTVITAIDERHQLRTIQLFRGFVFAESTAYRHPGILSLDTEPVPIRSEAEAKLVTLLRTAEIQYFPPEGESADKSLKISPNAMVLSEDIRQVLTRDPEENIRALRDDVVACIESPQYASSAAS